MNRKGKKSSTALMRKRFSRPTVQAEKRAMKDLNRRLVGPWVADEETILLQMQGKFDRIRW